MPWLQLPSWLVYHLGSGHAFFLALGLLFAGMALNCARCQRLVVAQPGRLLVLLGVLVLVFAACPLPLWLYALWLIACVGCLWLEENRTEANQRSFIYGRTAFVSVTLIALAWELPFHVEESVPVQEDRALTIIGDSVSALQEGAEPWPILLAREHRLTAHDLAVPGATLASAREQVQRLPSRPGLVLLEIGGNDLLNGRDSKQFAEDLDDLLMSVTSRGHTTVIMELPLPPFNNAIGAAQREIARRHGVMLIPKRVFIGVLATPGATSDGIHLSPTGHKMMAEAVWSRIGPAFSD